METAVVHARGKFASFEPEKAIAAVGLLIDRSRETLYPIMKMMYLADRLHLSRYGRFIAGDTYTAMSEGPVPSITYDLLKHVRGEPKTVPGVALAEKTFAFMGNHTFALKEAPAYDELSDSDVECLEEVLGLLTKYGRKTIANMSHDDAWAAKRKGLRSFMRTCDMPIEDIAAHLDNAEALIAHLKDPFPGSA